MLRNSSNETETMDFLNNKFVNRGYSRMITNNTLVPFSHRTQHLTTYDKANSNAVAVICTLDKERKFIKAIGVYL